MRKQSICMCVFLCLALIGVQGGIVSAQNPGDIYMWNFNEGEGTVVTDDSGQFDVVLGKPGLGSPVVQEDSPSGQAGDRSVVANGLTVDDSDNPILDLQQGPVTFEAWVKPINLTGNQDIVRIGNSLKVGFAGTNLLFTLLGIVDVNSNVPIPVDDDAWHHVAYAWDPGVDVAFFLDGEEVARVAETRGARDYQNSLMSIGSDHVGNSPLQAGLDRFRVHNAVLEAGDLDSDAANPKPLLDSTVVAYDFNETGQPFQNSTSTPRPASSLLDLTIPQFSSDTPAGEEGDYSLYFDGNDRAIYDDNVNYLLDFLDEPFTFEVWVKFRSEEQIANSGRPVLLAYGVGGQGGYSFSFRPAPVNKAVSVEDSPSGQAGDLAVQTNTGLNAHEADNNPFTDLAAGPVTIEAWVKPENIVADTDLVRIGNSIKAGFRDSNLIFTLLGVADVVATDAVISPTNAWHHVAYAWEPGVGVTYYVDGQEAAFVAQTGSPRAFDTNQLSIGSSHTGGSVIPGLIDRVRIHHALLDASQLDSDANNPAEPLEETVVAYNFNESAPPYTNETSDTHSADNRGNFVTVTTYGIVDAHSNAEIPDDGNWHHLAAVFDWDGYAFRYYVDGKLSDVYPYDRGVNPAPGEQAFFYIGGEAGEDYYFVGNMDRLKITRASLAPEELDYFEPVSVVDWSLH
ncbi:MAG: LamG-like jellyroll fold domain-containing protein [bacterium]|jgi:hypothetical protein